MLSSFSLTAKDQDTGKQLAMMRTYLATLKDEVEAELSGIGYNNLDADLRARIDKISDGLASAHEDTALVAQSLKANYITASEIASNYVSTSYLSANYITASEIASDYASFTWVNALNAIVANLNAKAITTDNLSAQSISASQITSGTLSANRISNDTFNGREMHCGTVQASSALIGITCSVNTVSCGGTNWTGRTASINGYTVLIV